MVACSPTFMSMGNILILPLGNLTELWMKDMKFSWKYYVGMMIILIGFCTYSFDEWSKARTEDALKKEMKVETPEIKATTDKSAEALEMGEL